MAETGPFVGFICSAGLRCNLCDDMSVLGFAEGHWCSSSLWSLCLSDVQSPWCGSQTWGPSARPPPEGSSGTYTHTHTHTCRYAHINTQFTHIHTHNYKENTLNTHTHTHTCMHMHAHTKHTHSLLLFLMAVGGRLMRSICSPVATKPYVDMRFIDLGILSRLLFQISFQG